MVSAGGDGPEVRRARAGAVRRAAPAPAGAGMDHASESLLIGLVAGLVIGVLVGMFTGQLTVWLLAGAIGGILAGSALDLPALVERPDPARRGPRDPRGL